MVFSIDKFNEWCDNHNISESNRAYFLTRTNLKDGSSEDKVPKIISGEWVLWLINDVEYHFVNFLKK